MADIHYGILICDNQLLCYRLEVAKPHHGVPGDDGGLRNSKGSAPSICSSKGAKCPKKMKIWRKF